MKRKLVLRTLCTLLSMLLAFGPGVANAASYPSVIMIMVCNVDGGRVRTAPGSANDVVASLRRGERAFYLNEMSGSHMLVRTSRGTIGYIYKDFMQFYGAARTDQIYSANYQGVRVYRQPASGAKTAGSLDNAEHIIIYKIAGDWGLCKTLYGGTGYVRMSDVSRIV